MVVMNGEQPIAIGTPTEQEATPWEQDRQDAAPTGITLPRPWQEYRMEAEFADLKGLRRAVSEALDDVVLIPQRYAELMWLIDSWFVEDHHGLRQFAIERAQQRFRGQ